MINEDDKETARFKTEQNVLLAKIRDITPQIREFLWHEETKQCWPSKDGVQTITSQDDPNIGFLANTIVKLCDNPAALLLFNEPASQRSTSMLEKKLNESGAEVFTNRTMELFARTIPEAEGIGVSLVEERCVFFDLFWWHLPFKYNLRKFMTWLAAERTAFFNVLKQ